MAYNMTFWQDHVTEFINKFREYDNPDGSVTHVPHEGEVLQEGTPQNAANFNNIERGVFSNNQIIAELTRIVGKIQSQVQAGFAGRFAFSGDAVFNLVNFGYFDGTGRHMGRRLPHGDTLVFYPGFATFGNEETIILNNL